MSTYANETKNETHLSSSKYGYGFCKPKWLQFGNNAAGFLVCYSFFVVVQGMLVNGFVNVGISSIEQRFGLRSSETSVVGVSYDIAFCLCTLFVTYFWSTSHRPRVVACGCLTMAAGAVVFSLPHFTTGLYQYTNNFKDTCLDVTNDDNCSKNNNLHNYLYVFILGQLMHGVGCTPLYTLGLSFIEDSVPKESASLYLGFANGASIFGPVLGYGLGGLFLGYYVDFNSVAVSEIELSASDPRWIGAWWIGMLISALLAVLIAIPIFGFPSRFVESIEYAKTKNSEIHQNGEEDITKDKEFGKSIKDFPRAFLLLVRNPTYVFVSLAGASEAMLVAGFTTFLPKIIENQFQVSSGIAAVVSGVISVPGGVLGHILAGLIVKCFKLKTASILKLNSLYCLLTICGIPTLYLYCKNISIAGITSTYQNQLQVDGLLSDCNVECNCQQEYFIPVCGDDNITYFSACHAGCKTSFEVDGVTKYSDCNCLSDNNATFQAIEGQCKGDCDTLYTFLGIFFVVVMFTFMSSTPSLVVTFRVVPSKLRSFALGLQWLVIRALGSIPGPILFGVIIDSVCILWQKRSCDKSTGSCWVYDSDKLTINVVIICAIVKCVSVVFFSLAWILYKPPLLSEDENEKIDGLTNKSFTIDEIHDTKM